MVDLLAPLFFFGGSGLIIVLIFLTIPGPVPAWWVDFIERFHRT